MDLDSRSIIQPKQKHRTRGSIILPYIEIPCIEKNQKMDAIVKNIVVGPSDTDGYTFNSVNVYFQNKGYNIEIGRSSVPFRNL